jgi:hypothetical protein
LNQHGFLKRSKFLPGNISEPASLQDAVKTLSSSEDLFKPTIVMDAGIATEGNLSWLRENHYTYIVAARQHAPPAELTGESTLVGNSTNYQVKVMELPMQGQEKMDLLRICCESSYRCFNEKRYFRNASKAPWRSLQQGSTSPKDEKKTAKVIERVGRLKEKHRLISSCYDIKAITSEDGLTVTRLEWSAMPEKTGRQADGSLLPADQSN